MDDLLLPADVEALARKVGKSMADVCREANVAASTFTRWKAGKTEPTLSIYRKLVLAARTPRAQPSVTAA